MANAFDPAGDFTTIVDAAEPLTLLRRGGNTQVAIATAWRQVDRRSEAEPAGGHLTQADTLWQFEWPAGTRLPQLGDRLRDGAGECHTILAIVQLQGGTRVRCEARSLRIACGLDARLDIEQAVWDAGEITGWTIIRPAVAARIQPQETTVDETADPITSTATYHVTFDDDLALDHNHRLVGSDGSVYRLLSYTGTERIDRLPVAVVRGEG